MAEGRGAAGLALLLRALSGQVGHVQWMDETPTAPALRPVLTDTHLLLPEALHANDRLAAVAHAAAHRMFSTPHQPAAGLRPISQIVIASLEDARVEHLLAEQLPGARRWFLRGLQLHRAEGLGFADLLARMSRALWDEGWVDPNPWVHKARDSVREVVATQGWTNAAALRRVGAVLANDLGQMRVRLDLATYAEPTAYRDDNSWLWQHEATSTDAQALEAAPANPRPDSGQAAPAIPESPRIWTYPEWDHRTHHLRANWCTVLEHVVGVAACPPLQHREGATPLLRLPWARRHRQRVRRQLHGEALDLEACVRFAADRRQGSVDEPRLFQRQVRRRVSAAVLVLLDLSASTGDALPGGSSMLALEKQAARLLAHAATVQGRRVAVHGFSSDTRHAVAYQHLLDFGEPLAEAEARLQAAVPRHSTRLGAALRHAAALLAVQPAEQHLLLMLTDGAPSDIDVADPRYLVEDARHAVREARRRGVELACLATDPQAEAALGRMFGRRYIRIVQTPERLPAQLVALHERLAR